MVESRCGILCASCGLREPMNCGGCIETMGHPFHGKCPVAHCAQEKKHSHCGECGDFPCKQLVDYSNDPEHGDNPKGARIERCRKWMEESVK